MVKGLHNNKVLMPYVNYALVNLNLDLYMFVCVGGIFVWTTNNYFNIICTLKTHFAEHILFRKVLLQLKVYSVLQGFLLLLSIIGNKIFHGCFRHVKQRWFALSHLQAIKSLQYSKYVFMDSLRLFKCMSMITLNAMLSDI